MISNQQQFETFLAQRGVGSSDKVADSVKSYVSYLNGVSKHLTIEITPNTLSSQPDIDVLTDRLQGKVSPKTIQNYRTAMKHYIEMVRESI